VTPSPELSAIVLCYRAGHSAPRLLDPLAKALDESGVSYELVLVANYDVGRADSTPSVVSEWAVGRENVQVVSRPKKGAMGWDMRSGFEAATGSILVVIDGDEQNPVEDVSRMYEEMRRTGVDVCKGRRVVRDDGIYRRAISEAYNFLFRVLFGTRGISDINGKPKGLTREAYERLRLRSDDWFIDAEIVLEARRLGMNIGELPVVFRENPERASFVKPSAILEFVRNMLRYRLRRGR
jgi:glycosyltransferase involved in cell wall biosynthesis